ncbi:MAG: phosphatase [Firmicutes bacterium]|nr:phosphatase [Bacillota bacterium]
MKLVADLHVHTIASGHAYSTIEETARAASGKGLEMIAFTEHGPNLPGGPHLYYFGNLRVIPETMFGVEILNGVEANIINLEGELDIPERILSTLDFVLAGFHVRTGYDGGAVEENTRAMIAAMHNPYVDAIAHPGNPEYQVDIEKVVKAAKDLGVLLEINNSSLTITRKHSEENCCKFARLAARHGARVAIGSDAHISMRVGLFDAAIELAEGAGLTEDLIINASVDRVRDFLKGRGKLKGRRLTPRF